MAGDDSDSALRQATEELFALDPADFVAARNALVRRLRKEKHREQAEAVARLRRPTPVAWAVNQLARRHREELDALLALGDALRTAQTQTLAGADAADLRQAGRVRRDAVAGLADLATAFLADRGAGADAHRAEVIATLEAASLDPQAAVEVSSGRLTSGLDPPSGFGEIGGFGGDDAGPPARPRSASSGAEVDGPAPVDADVDAVAGAERAEAERAAAEAGQRATDLAVNAADAVALVAERRRQAEAADAEVGELERALDEARRRADASRRAADEAQGDAEATEAAAARADEQRREADRRLEDLCSR